MRKLILCIFYYLINPRGANSCFPPKALVEGSSGYVGLRRTHNQLVADIFDDHGQEFIKFRNGKEVLVDTAYKWG
ncbi:hypothetical protein [Nostoc flagelliforme]|uniref:hypothetical protein n=1 Tax=Nostoc flagelliforme TaxID=1306274 RepID=UPI000C2D54A4